jgi:Nucleotide modification associated domain 2
MPSVYIYVVDRDLGFAPNPFHGFCSLATCKPRIRNSAQIGDWIVGVGGGRLRAPGRCVFAMKVSRKVTFNEYWENDEFKDKRPVRNGSKKMMLGDNIYFHNAETNTWTQAHSHHSHPDGTLNEFNKNRDTQSRNVLLSNHFYYFGSAAPEFPTNLLKNIGYENGIGHRKFSFDEAETLVEWLQNEQAESFNLVVADPFDFDKSQAHYSVGTNRITI